MNSLVCYNDINRNVRQTILSKVSDKLMELSFHDSHSIGQIKSSVEDIVNSITTAVLTTIDDFVGGYD
jgi:hypothetical protein